MNTILTVDRGRNAKSILDLDAYWEYLDASDRFRVAFKAFHRDGTISRAEYERARDEVSPYYTAFLDAKAAHGL